MKRNTLSDLGVNSYVTTTRGSEQNGDQNKTVLPHKMTQGYITATHVGCVSGPLFKDFCFINIDYYIIFVSRIQLVQ